MDKYEEETTEELRAWVLERLPYSLWAPTASRAWLLLAKEKITHQTEKTRDEIAEFFLGWTK